MTEVTLKTIVNGAVEAITFEARERVVIVVNANIVRVILDDGDPGAAPSWQIKAGAIEQLAGAKDTKQ